MTLVTTWQDDLKRYIRAKVVMKSDTYYSDLLLDDFKIEPTREIDLAFYKKELSEKEIPFHEDRVYYDLKFKVNSDSYKIWKLYDEKCGDVSKDDILSLDIPTIVKHNFINVMEEKGVDGAMNRFKLFNRGVYRTVARHHNVKLIEKIKEIFEVFARYRRSIEGLGKFEEMVDDDAVRAFHFVRQTRVKRDKKNDDPACFDGNCLEKNILNGKIAIFGREVS